MAGKAGLGNVESSTWLAIAAWAALAVVAVALIVMYRQIQRNQQLTSEQARPYVSMLMEPHITDWHVIELVVRNFGRTAAYNVQFSFPVLPQWPNTRMRPTATPMSWNCSCPASCRRWHPVRNGGWCGTPRWTAPKSVRVESRFEGR